MALKYLFGVQYLDGSQFYQTQEDKSETREGGSAFTDVNQEQVHIFQLANWEAAAVDMHTPERYLVDLTDGHFEVGGFPFFAQIPPVGSKLRLIYFRRTRIHMQIGGEEIAREVEYHFGWQTTCDGRNYQQTLILE
jgi:hypothetical protein